MLANINEFLDKFFDSFKKLGVNCDGFEIDHVAYQASSSEDYESLKPRFEEVGEMVSESVVGGRRVGIYKLNRVLVYMNYSIPAVELIESKDGQECDSEWQHVEFVIDESLREFADRYANVSMDLSAIDRDEFPKVQTKLENGFGVKFHVKSVLEEIESK